ncbi:MAG: glycosyltransferase, partial [bacterium]
MESKKSKNRKEISVVIPVRSEADNLNPLYTQLKSVMESLDRSYEIIFVDDGSSDGSFSILEELHQKDQAVKVIQFRKNFGKAAALAAGFSHAEGEVVITLDA